MLGYKKIYTWYRYISQKDIHDTGTYHKRNDTGTYQWSSSRPGEGWTLRARSRALFQSVFPPGSFYINKIFRGKFDSLCTAYNRKSSAKEKSNGRHFRTHRYSKLSEVLFHQCHASSQPLHCPSSSPLSPLSPSSPSPLSPSSPSPLWFSDWGPRAPPPSPSLPALPSPLCNCLVQLPLFSNYSEKPQGPRNCQNPHHSFAESCLFFPLLLESGHSRKRKWWNMIPIESWKFRSIFCVLYPDFLGAVEILHHLPHHGWERTDCRRQTWEFQPSHAGGGVGSFLPVILTHSHRRRRICQPCRSPALRLDPAWRKQFKEKLRMLCPLPDFLTLSVYWELSLRGELKPKNKSSSHTVPLKYYKLLRFLDNPPNDKVKT